MRGSPSRVSPAGPLRLRTRRSPCSVGGFPGVARAPRSLLPGLRAARRPSRGRPPARPSVSAPGSSLPCSEVRDLPELSGRGGWRRSCLTAGRGGHRPRGARPAARGPGRAQPRLRPRERDPRTRRGQKLFGGASIKAEGAAASLPLPPDTPRRQLTHLNAPILNLSVAPGSLSRARPHRPATQLCSHHLNDPLRNPTASSWSTRDTHCRVHAVLRSLAAPAAASRSRRPRHPGALMLSPGSPPPHTFPRQRTRSLQLAVSAAVSTPNIQLPRTVPPGGSGTHPLTGSETELITVFLETGLVQTAPH
ncbi:uncharacterized protein [Eschrichtius robustus]|uniref:uncharacterized protein n=1 Tax=Eschrichtius robustus TaxID=9764 RepID=UPI0035C09649